MIELDFEIGLMRGDLEHILQVSLDVKAVVEKSYFEDHFGRFPSITIKDLVVCHAYIWNKFDEVHEDLYKLPLDEFRAIMLKAVEKAEPKILRQLASEVA